MKTKFFNDTKKYRLIEFPRGLLQELQDKSSVSAWNLNCKLRSFLARDVIEGTGASLGTLAGRILPAYRGPESGPLRVRSL